jgi:type IV pilus assembly protein PilB
MRDRQRPRVGEILVRAGVIDEHQLKAALGEQRRWGRPLGATLVKLGFLEEKELVRALASQLGLPMAVLDGKRIPADVLALVPREVAEREMIIPLFVREEGGRRALYVGVEDPGNLAAFDDLAFSTGMEIKLVMVGPSELCEAIDRCYHRTPTDAPTQPSVPVVAPGTEELARHWSQAAPDPAPDPPEEQVLRTVAASSAAAEAAGGPITGPPASPTSVASAGPPGSASEPAADQPTSTAPEPDAPAPAAAEPIALDDPIDRVASTFALEEPVAEVQPPPRPAAATPVSAVARVPDAPESAPDRTRTILRALAEILIDKGVVSREELHARVRDLERAAAPRD